MFLYSVGKIYDPFIKILPVDLLSTGDLHLQ